MIRVLVFITSLWPGLALACQPQDLFELMQLRLSYMPAVAAQKQQAGKPIEDLSREAVVLRRTLEKAMGLGLPRTEAEQFIQGQITAAKQVQYRHSQPGGQSLTQVREQLLDLGDQQLQQVYCLRQAGWSAAAAARPVFRRSFSADLLSPQQLRQLFLALPSGPVEAL